MSAHVMPTQPVPGAVLAWRCEQCRKLYPVSIPSEVILVDEISARWSYTGSVSRHGRFLRMMVVCPPCRRSIAGVPAQEVQDGDRPSPTAENQRAEDVEGRKP